ncbi:MAG: ribulose-phosphate 3-epimerase [Caldilineae bacterium]|nr:ribulose-phosphate 3-epimerase [Chloroflexota bacterium]MCB9176183.1 ribulose-phosphate 3-epimerase [Caldilineae bacterium]
MSPVDPRVEILPSILSADFSQLGQEVAAVGAAGVTALHVDVMDGRFVPNISIGLPVLRSLRKASDLMLDTHLMIVEPERYALDFVRAGADGVTIHVEATAHPHRVLQQLRDAGVRAGVALNPGTPIGAIEELLPYLDLVLIMTVNPGFGGQTFIGSMLSKVERLRARIEADDLPITLQVDGGIGPGTATAVVAAGARELVAGSAVYAAGRPVAEALSQLRAAAEAGLPRALPAG